MILTCYKFNRVLGYKICFLGMHALNDSPKSFTNSLFKQVFLWYDLLYNLYSILDSRICTLLPLYVLMVFELDNIQVIRVSSEIP